MNINIADFKLSFDKVANSSLLSLKLRVSHNKTRKRFAFPLKEPILISKENLDKLIKYHQTQNQRTAEDIRVIYAKIQPSLEKAQSIIDTLNPFSFEKFKAQFYGEIVDTGDNSLVSIAGFTASEHLKAGKVTTSNLYISAAKSIQEFADQLLPGQCAKFSLSKIDRTVRLGHITEEFLQDYEDWMIKKKGKTPSTVGIYLRNVRAIFNDEIAKKNINPDLYPFGKRKYVIPSAANTKKAIPKESIIKLLGYEPLPNMEMEQRSKDFYTFSYLSNGMNMADILNLKWENVDFESRKITFVREKTKDTTKNQQVTITVQMFDETIRIIKRWGSKTKNASDYLFPYYTRTMSPVDKRRVKAQFIKSTNYNMRKIAKILGITEDPLTMSARHSFATIMMQNNSPIALISKLLGHTDMKTTQNYLDSFEDGKVKEFLGNLL